MAISAYTVTAPVFAQRFIAFSTILDKAQAHCEAKKIEPAILMGLRLYPDMFPFDRQVRQSTVHAMSVSRLAGLTPPDLGSDEKTIADLKARLAKTVDFIRTWPKDGIDGGLDREIVIKLGSGDRTFTGQSLIDFALPNFYFHLVTAYDILRHIGADIGKRDFMGTPVQL